MLTGGGSAVPSCLLGSSGGNGGGRGGGEPSGDIAPVAGGCVAAQSLARGSGVAKEVGPLLTGGGLAAPCLVGPSEGNGGDSVGYEAKCDVMHVGCTHEYRLTGGGVDGPRLVGIGCTGVMGVAFLLGCGSR